MIRWLLVLVMIFCVYRIGVGLFFLKQQQQVGYGQQVGFSGFRGVWSLISGSFFFIISYVAHWLLRD